MFGYLDDWALTLVWVMAACVAFIAMIFICDTVVPALKRYRKRVGR